MDGQRFDRLARTVAAHASRRQLVRLAAGMALAGMLPGRAQAMQEASEATDCDAGLTFCTDAGACVDLQTDMANCGACGSVCESQLVPVACRAGECVRADCPPGIEYCGAVDLCRDLSIDPEHCGGCGNACASGLCVDGACADAPGQSCAAGQTNCGGVCIDTCCDNANCGACGIACPAGTTCFEGQCGCPSGFCCAEGETICDGACVATCCDNANCGACGNACANGETCFEGVCGCPSGLCGPVTPPNTGSGTAGSGARIGAWAALALSGAAASVAALLRKPSARRGTAPH